MAMGYKETSERLKETKESLKSCQKKLESATKTIEELRNKVNNNTLKLSRRDTKIKVLTEKNEECSIIYNTAVKQYEYKMEKLVKTKDATIARLQNRNKELMRAKRLVSQSNRNRGYRIDSLSDKVESTEEELKAAEREQEAYKTRVNTTLIKVKKKLEEPQVKYVEIPQKLPAKVSRVLAEVTNPELSNNVRSICRSVLKIDELMRRSSITFAQFSILVQCYVLEVFRPNQIDQFDWTSFNALIDRGFVVPDLSGGRVRAKHYYITKEGKRVIQKNE